MKGESDIEGKQRGNEARAADKRARSVPEWEELGYTPAGFVRVANAGLTDPNRLPQGGRIPHPPAIQIVVKRKELRERQNGSLSKQRG